jgi:hypothetical protein
MLAMIYLSTGHRASPPQGREPRCQARSHTICGPIVYLVAPGTSLATAPPPLCGYAHRTAGDNQAFTVMRDDRVGKPCGAVMAPQCHPPLWLSEGPKRDSRVLPCPSAVPDLPALLLRMGVSITMYISKPEPTIEELLSDPVMVTVLHHFRTTPDDLRGLLRDARERLAKATAAEASERGE